jgi:hypothetical protein
MQNCVYEYSKNYSNQRNSDLVKYISSKRGSLVESETARES